MKYLLKTIIIITLFSSCSTYTISTKKVKNEVLIGNNSIEGFYYNGSDYSTFWNQVSTKNKKTNYKKNEIVEVVQLSPTLIKLRLLEDKSSKDSLYIKGKFKGDRFEFKTRKYIEDLFPLFWTYTKEKFIIESDTSKNLTLTSDGWGLNIFIFVPIMAADGHQKFNYKRQQN
jgi:hypothetical protein